MSTANNPTSVHKSLLDLVNGLTSAPPGGQTTYVILGQSLGITDVVGKLQTHAATIQHAFDMDNAHTSAVQVRTAAMPSVVQFRDAVHGVLRGMFGNDAAALAKFGMVPRKVPPPMTDAQRAERNAKAKATRAARHTMGKRQKAAIKGVLPSTPVVTPATLGGSFPPSKPTG